MSREEVKKVENLKIRRKLKEMKVLQWQLAEKMEVSEMTLVRKLRRELEEEEQKRIIAIIEDIAKDNKNNQRRKSKNDFKC